MATNTTSYQADRETREDEEEPRVGISHVTVVPTNFEADEQ